MTQTVYKVLAKGHCIDLTVKHAEALDTFKDSTSNPRELIKIHEDGHPELLRSVDVLGRYHEHA